MESPRYRASDHVLSRGYEAGLMSGDDAFVAGSMIDGTSVVHISLKLGPDNRIIDEEGRPIVYISATRLYQYIVSTRPGGATSVDFSAWYTNHAMPESEGF